MAVAQVLADDRAVLAFHEGIVIATAGAGFGEFLDVELVEQGGDAMVDVLGAVVGMKAADDKREGEDQGFQNGQQEAFADALDGGDVLELGDLVDGIDEVEALDAIEVAWVDAIDAQEAGLALGPGLAALADSDRPWARLADRHPLAPIGFGLAEVVEVAVGDRGQALIARIAEHPEGAFAQLFGGRPGERAVEGVQFGQGEDVGGRITSGKGPGGRLLAAILQPALAAVLCDQAGHLLPGKAGDLDHETPHHALGGLAQARVLQAPESVGDEGVDLLAVWNVEFEGLATVQKGLDLVQGEGIGSLESHDHAPMIPDSRPSSDSCVVGNTSPHSDSYVIGKGLALTFAPPSCIIC